MRICFFGHAEFNASNEVEQRLLTLLKDYTSKYNVEFLFGGYGRFDDFALKCVNSIQSSNNIRRIFVTPYITEEYKYRLEYARHIYDEIIYPEIENTPLRFAISARNKWMVNNCDVIICYINHTYGGAYSAVKWAKEKMIINLGKIEI